MAEIEELKARSMAEMGGNPNAIPSQEAQTPGQEFAGANTVNANAV